MNLILFDINTSFYLNSERLVGMLYDLHDIKHNNPLIKGVDELINDALEELIRRDTHG